MITIKLFQKKGILILFVLMIALVVVSGCSNAEPERLVPADEVDWGYFNDRAETFIKSMADGDFGAARGMFDSTMTRMVNEPALKGIWDELLVRAGNYVATFEIVNVTHESYNICLVTSRHDSSGVTLRVVFSEDGLIAGLFVDDYPTISDSDALSEAVQRDGFVDHPVVIGEGGIYSLNGILSMPDDADGPVPVVVIVHGSWPGDMDGTLFANKPYRDIAEFLAANGIATIRYDKRTRARGIFLRPDFTVWEETIEDAILAADLLRADPRIDANRVFIVGHSLGGMLAPRIHVEGGAFAGLVILAGSPRFLLDISQTQNLMLIEATMEGEEKEAALAEFLDAWDEQVKEILDMSEEVAREISLPSFGASAYYYVDLYNNPVSYFIDRVRVPMLLMQGSDDVQILADLDFRLYQEMLEGRSDVTFVLYPGLNHMFMPSSGGDISNIMVEYEIESRVDDKVLADIVAWIKSN